MNEYIGHIKRIDEQLKAINRIKDHRDFMVAGLEISLNVGPCGADEEPDVAGIQLGISGLPEDLLALLIESLTRTRAYWINAAHLEVMALQDFLGNLK